jgi:hypothetical protein
MYIDIFTGSSYMIRKVLYSPILLFLVPLAYGQDQGTYDHLKPRVIEFFKKAAGVPGSCEGMREILVKNTGNEQMRKMMTGLCDSDIDFSKPVAFSEMSSHQIEGHTYICGVLSGKTKLNRKIGARFISAEPYHLILGAKYSRRPIAYTTNDAFLIEEYHSQIRYYNKLYDKYCT